MSPEQGNRKGVSARRTKRRPAERKTSSSADSVDSPLAGLSDLARRALGLGFSGFFLTEETIRRALGDTLPRDWIDFAVDQSERTRAEFVERLAQELAGVVDSLDVEGMATRFLEGRTIELRAEIRVLPRSKRAARTGSSRIELSLVPEGKKK